MTQKISISTYNTNGSNCILQEPNTICAYQESGKPNNNEIIIYGYENLDDKNVRKFSELFIDKLCQYVNDDEQVDINNLSMIPPITYLSNAIKIMKFGVNKKPELISWFLTRWHKHIAQFTVDEITEVTIDNILFQYENTHNKNLIQALRGLFVFVMIDEIHPYRAFNYFSQIIQKMGRKDIVDLDIKLKASMDVFGIFADIIVAKNNFVIEKKIINEKKIMFLNCQLHSNSNIALFQVLLLRSSKELFHGSYICCCMGDFRFKWNSHEYQSMISTNPIDFLQSINRKKWNMPNIFGHIFCEVFFNELEIIFCEPENANVICHKKVTFKEFKTKNKISDGWIDHIFLVKNVGSSPCNKISLQYVNSPNYIEDETMRILPDEKWNHSTHVPVHAELSF
jgi:hypothetical protein